MIFPNSKMFKIRFFKILKLSKTDKKGEKRTREAAQVAQNLGKAAGAAGFELGQAATEFGAQTDKLAAARAAGQAPSEQREQMKTTLAAANKVESEAAKALRNIV